MPRAGSQTVGLPIAIGSDSEASVRLTDAIEGDSDASLRRDDLHKGSLPWVHRIRRLVVDLVGGDGDVLPNDAACMAHKNLGTMRFVDVEEARAAAAAAPGVRLVLVGATPSPWSEAAKGIFVTKGIDGMLVRFSPSDAAVKQWTGFHNAPVLFIDSEPPRAHWSDILEAAERLGGRASLVPADADERTRMFGLAHELMGEGGLVWNGRLLVIHRGLTTEGRDGFPLRLSSYLAPKYGYAPDRAVAAKDRVLSVLERFGRLVEGSRARGKEYLFGDRLSALDIYLATALAPFAPLPEDQCPGVHPAMRHAFETAYPELTAAVPAALREHRDLMYGRHLGLPIEL